MNNLVNLRKKIKENNLDGMIIPLSDPFQNDFIPEYYQRIKFLSGFTGSLGTLVVLPHSAALFVDGRYSLQATEEVDTRIFEIKNHGFASIIEWIQQKKQTSVLCLGYDAWDYTASQISELEKANDSIKFQPLNKNLVDEIWKDQPKITKTKIFLYPEKYTSLNWSQKLDLVAQDVEKKHLDAVFLTSAASICWLLNIRGQDVPYTPISLCYALVHKTGKVDVFTYLENLTPKIKKHFSPRVTFHKLSGPALETVLPTLTAGLKVGYPKKTAPIKIKSILKPATSLLKNIEDPCSLLKACKTSMEISHAQKAHIWDGVALVKFLYWLEQTVPHQSITEFEAARKIDTLRAENKNFKGPSFPTIAGINENASIVHYRPRKNSQVLKPNDLFLCDSGGQYFEGTTDVTRTICLNGHLPSQKKNLFTRVLKGFIALFLVRFPFGTSGSQLDILARRFLWEVGIDYAHSTGHGVGQYLNVHEGPQNISCRPSFTSLHPGMILSNEPGCYLKEEFGIRIENLMFVTESSQKDIHGKSLLKFKTLTLCPIDKRCIDVSMLSDDEITWLNHYHQTVWQSLHKLLPADEKAWLKEATAPLVMAQAFSHQDSIRDSITG